jgi:hypothetical protein
MHASTGIIFCTPNMEYWYLQPKNVEFLGPRDHSVANIMWYHQYSIPRRVILFADWFVVADRAALSWTLTIVPQIPLNHCLEPFCRSACVHRNLHAIRRCVAVGATRMH